MKKVNLRDLYPDVYKTDHFVEVTEDVLETIRAAERAEAAYERRMYRYKAYYSGHKQLLHAQRHGSSPAHLLLLLQSDRFYKHRDISP